MLASDSAVEPLPPVVHRTLSRKELAEQGLRHNSYLALRNVSCEDHEGVLVLRGCLPSYYLKQVAQEIVAHLPGVGRVDNQIEVVTPPGRSRRN